LEARSESPALHPHGAACKMIITPPPTGRPTLATSRALIVGLALIPVTIVVASMVPALAIMTFLPDGWKRAEPCIRQISSWTTSILVHSTPTSPSISGVLAGNHEFKDLRDAQ
jgi:hypothetical protein